MHTRERRQLRLFVRRDTYGRYLSVPGLPAPRPLQHRRPRADRADPQGPASAASRVEFTARVSESTTGPAALRRAPAARAATIPDVDAPTSSAGSPRRPARGATTSSPPRIAEYGEEDGARLARTYADSFPEAYKEDFPPRTGAVDLGRLEGIAADGGHRPVRSTSRSTPVRGEARLKVFRIGSPLSLSRGAADAVVDGRRGRRRAALRARRRSSGRVVHLRLRAALRAARCPTSARELFQDAVRAVWDGYNEIDGFNALVLAAGLTWRQATVLRAYAKYMRQGGTPVRAGLHRGRAARQRRHHPAARRSCSRRASTPGRNGDSPPTPRPGRREVEEIEDRIEPGPRRRRQPRPRPDPALLPHPHPGDPAHQLLPARRRRAAPSPTSRSSSSPSAIPDLPRAAAEVRDLRLLPAGRGRAPALRPGRPRRPALVRPPRRLPHRGARPGQGADGQEHRDRAGRRQGRLLLQAAARPRRPRRVAGRGRRLLQDVHLRPARHHRQPRRRRDRAAGAAWCATTATTPTSWSPPTRAPRRSPTSPTAWPRTTASGSATRSPPAARSATTTRRWASPPAAPGCRCSGTSARWASTARPRTSPASASATCPATCSATACCCSEHTRLVAAFDHRDIFLDPTPDAATSYAERQRLFDAAAVELAGLRHVA